MRWLPAALLLLALLAGAGPARAQEVMPAGITCCDEELIRAAMAEEALARIVAIAASDRSRPADYLSLQAYETVRRSLPAGDAPQRLAFLRGWLQAPAGGAAGAEFRLLVGHFVLGMTLEIGHTLQDEYDQAQLRLEQADRLAAELEREPATDAEALSRALFRTGVSDRELRRLRALDRRWQEPPADSDRFDCFNLFKKNATGRPGDPDQRMAFDLADRYDARFPFIDEFLANYRRLAEKIRATARRIGELLSQLGGIGEK
jgi:hypothetical protein